MNEPNIQVWPTDSLDSVTAQMMITAESAATYANWPVTGQGLLAPAVADGSEPGGDPRGKTAHEWGWLGFTEQVAYRLSNFKPRCSFFWSHHNYKDVRAPLAGTDSRARQVTLALSNNQWKTSAGDRLVFLTEGGFQRSDAAYPSAQGDLQASLISDNFQRMLNTPNIYMWTQYVELEPQGPSNTYPSGLRLAYVAADQRVAVYPPV